MIIGIMQPYFFPYIGYWQLINMVDEYVIFDDVNYIKRGWMHRNNVLMNGKKKQINLHIKDASQNRLIKDTQIAQTEEDNKRLLETIKHCYHKAPYFEETNALLQKVLNYKSMYLADYLLNQIIEIARYLNIDTKFIKSSEIEKNNELKASDKIIDICKRRGADCYVNAIGGKELYHHNDFRSMGIELKFLRTQEISYRQFTNEFVPNLSIIDLMMFNDVKTIKKLLKCCSLED